MEILLKKSKILLIAYLIVHLLAVLVIFYWQGKWFFKLPLLIMIGIHCYFFVIKFNKETVLGFDKKGWWGRVDGELMRLNLLPDSVLCSFLLSLHFKTVSKKRLNVLLLPGLVDKKIYKKIIRFARGLTNE